MVSSYYLVKLLAKNGADVSTSNNICFINAIKNDDFLSQAASDLKPKIVDYLLSNGANIHADNDKALKSILEYPKIGSHTIPGTSIEKT